MITMKQLPNATGIEISRSRLVCEHRYHDTCEVVFSRFTDVHWQCLRDVVPYQYNDILKYAVHCGFAHNNMQQPLKKPDGYDAYVNSIKLN